MACGFPYCGGNDCAKCHHPAAIRAATPVYWQWRRLPGDWSNEYIFTYEVKATTTDSEVRQLFVAPSPSPSTEAAMRQGLWIERWHGSGPDRGWWVWETNHGNPVAYIGEGNHSEWLTSIIVEKHNAAIAALRAELEKVKT